MAVGNTDEGGEMGAGGIARDHDFLRWNSPVAAVSAQEADRGFQVVYLRWKLRLSREPIINAGDRILVFHQLSERHVLLRTGSPCAAVDPNEQWRSRFASRNVKVKFQRVVFDAGVFDVTND